MWFVGQSIANQCHGPLSDVPVVKLTNPMQLVIQFTVSFGGGSGYVSLSLSVSLFSLFFFHYGIFCLSVVVLTVHFCFPCLAVCICVCFLSLCECLHTETSVLSVCTHQHQSTCVYVCVVTVHASLWDALISAHCGSAPSCPCGWLLIETNQACDGPIAVTPHPSHPRPNNLLIGPRRAPSRWHRRLI